MVPRRAAQGQLDLISVVRVAGIAVAANALPPACAAAWFDLGHWVVVIGSLIAMKLRWSGGYKPQTGYASVFLVHHSGATGYTCLKRYRVVFEPDTYINESKEIGACPAIK